MQRIDANAAAALLQSGAVLVDIRERDEHARERIPGARHHPLQAMDSASLTTGGAQVIVFHCRSGMRTASNTAALSVAAGNNCDAYILDGGIDAWKHAGLPVERDASQPLELNRQVQIAAGSVIVLGAVLGFTLSPTWHALSATIGAGLVFAGTSGFCGLARVLVYMPWNRALRP